MRKLPDIDISGDSSRLLPIIRNHYGGMDAKMFGAEIGVHRGVLSAKLLTACPNLILFMIDPWGDLTSEPRYQQSKDVMGVLTKTDQDEFMAEALRNTAFALGRRAILRATSVQAANSIPGLLHWAFLDGCHHYDSVVEDMDVYWKKIAPGGFLAGHDYTHPSNRTGQFGVKRAVDEFLDRMSAPLRTNGSCWVIDKR